MITEDYVSYEVAKLLKEKGFDGPVLFTINAEGFHHYHRNLEFEYLHNSEVSADEYACPTLQMAMKWLRLERGIAIIPIVSSILDNEKFLWDVKIITTKNESYSQGWVYEKQEDAYQAAIKYCLINLI